MTHPVVIVGASMGGLRTAESLRRFGYTGPITVIGQEIHAPYNRPPLSKEVLAKEVTHEAVAFEQRPATADVNWVLGTKAVSLDSEHNTVTDSEGQVHQYSALVIATGLRPRRVNFPNGELANRFALRTLDDAIALRSQLSEGKNVVIIGGGFIGCEVAATATKLGCNVTVIHNAAHPMLRPLGTELASQMQFRHEAMGVRFLLKREAKDLVGDSHVTGVVLNDGTVIDCDVLIEAVGSLPNVEWLSNNNIDRNDGVLVDSAMRVMKKDGTAFKNIFAIGDVARFANPIFDLVPRKVEHWNIPTETAKRAGSVIASMLNGAEDYPAILDEDFKPVPSFWSDQYDIHLLAFGLLSLADKVTLVAGDVQGDCVFEYHRGDQLVGVCGIGMRSVVQSYRAKFV
ncbi:MAG: FAD-dependent oxidoreductase [Micrococcales bacterium]|nr:FAD-dependent oxidoreductase [Micrococcales bacterium]